MIEQEKVKRRRNIIENMLQQQSNINMRREDFSDPRRPLPDKREESEICKQVTQLDSVALHKLEDAVVEKIVISGFVSPDLILRRMQKLKKSRKQLKFLYLEIDFIENLASQGYLLNDFIFNVCVLKYFPFGEEPFFLPEDICVLIEVSPYLNNALYNQIVNLQLFRQQKLTFDLSRFDLNAHCDFEDDMRVVSEFYMENIKSGAVERREYLRATRFLIPLPNAEEKIETSHRQKLLKSQTKAQVMETIEALFIAEAKRNEVLPSFSLLKLFTKVVSHELRNLNSNFIYDMSKDYRKLKLELMPLITRLVFQNIQPSVGSRVKQESANNTSFDLKK